MNLREKVIVDGIPFIWSTNLDDEGIREFYELYADRIREPVSPEESKENSSKRKLAIRIQLRLAFLKFRDGVCLWHALNGNHSVLYRNNREWELFEARQKEIEELREEQAIERGLFENEDRYLAERTNAAIKAGQYDVAAAHVTARMSLRLNSKDIPGFSYYWTKRPTELWWILTYFPTSNYGIEFIRKHDAIPWAFESFAHWYAAHCGLQPDECAKQTWRIYEEAMKLFPDNVNLVKAACLFWRRMRRYDLAKQICSEAIKKGMKDGTKSGFEGRMKRLEKSQNKPMNTGQS